MKRDLTHAPRWGRSVDADVSATAGRLAHGRWRLALVGALALLGVLAFVAPASAFVRVTSFDGSRTPAGTMVPERMAVDETTGDVYIIDTASGVVDRFNRYGRYLSQLVGATTPLGGFGFDNANDDVAVDNSSTSTQGNVYVVGENLGFGSAIVTAFTRDGTLVCQAHSPLAPPTRLAGVAVNPTNGDFWVADRRQGMYRLSTTDCSSRGDTPFGLNGASPGPGAEAPVHIAFDASGNLYAAATQLPTVKYVPPFADPPTATIDPNGTFDVETDATNNDVYVDEGGHIAVYNSAGTQDPQSPFGTTSTVFPGIGVDGAADHIYVANSDTNAVEIWAHVLPRMDQLTVTVNGTGTGNVDADHGAILGCGRNGGPCTDGYIDGDSVRLTETPDAGMVFAGWSGPDGVACGTATTCDVPMNANPKSVTATFNVQQFRVTVVKNGSGTVTVAGTSNGTRASIVCDPTCSGLFDGGSSATATAVAAPGSTFAGWTVNGCPGTAPCSVNVNSDKTITATFTQNPPDVVTGSASGISQTGATVGGTVNPNGANVSDCHIDYGTSTSYGSSTACSPSPGSGTSAVSVGASLSGLSAATVYHYRVVATNTGGTTNGSDAQFTTAPITCLTDASLCPRPTCPQDLTKCSSAVPKQAGFSATTMLLRVGCTGFAGQTCSGKLTFKAVIKVRVKHGKKTRLVKKTITVATVSYSVAGGGTQSLKVKLTSAAKTALKSGGLTARAAGGFSIKLPKTKVRHKKRH